jgi:CBS-domain-containing membrane protein
MQADLETVTPDTSVNDVFVSLAESRVSALPVVDGAGRLVGVRKTLRARQDEPLSSRPRWFEIS